MQARHAQRSLCHWIRKGYDLDRCTQQSMSVGVCRVHLLHTPLEHGPESMGAQVRRDGRREDLRYDKVDVMQLIAQRALEV